MRFAFFGDSWVYHWAHSSDTVRLSNTFKDRYKVEEGKVLPDEASFLFGELLRSMGHEAISYGSPCSTLEYVIRDLEYKHDPSADFHVVFVPAVLRELSHGSRFWDKVPLDIRKSLEKFLQFYENYQLRLIWKLNRVAEEKNLRILLIGGHGPLTDTSAHSTNNLITVITKDLLKDLLLERDPVYAQHNELKYTNHFRFTTDIDFNTFAEEGWSKEIIQRMKADIEQTIDLDNQ